MPSEPAPDPDTLKRDINLQELQRLKELDVHVTSRDPEPIAGNPRGGKDKDFEQLKEWTERNISYIREAVAQRGFSGPYGSTLNWKCAFLAFLESAAVYLRDETKIHLAVQAFKRNEVDKALQLYESATDNIKYLANEWGLNFVVVCNFVEKHPDGHWFIVGPYCGAFYSKVPEKAFVSFAFKGTSTPWEWVNNILAIFPPVTTPPECLHETTVATGFYYPVFSNYDGIENSTPFDMMVKIFRILAGYTAEKRVVTHCTGHSLGAAYASLAYSQLTVVGNKIPRFVLGGLYTFGSPRVGHADFTKALGMAVSSRLGGSSWRIVNSGDHVASLPTHFFFNYVHVDKAFAIYANRLPTPIASEDTLNVATRGSSDQRLETHGFDIFAPHGTAQYSKSLMFAMTGEPHGKAAARSLAFLNAMTILGGETGLLRHINTFSKTTSVDINAFPYTTSVAVELDGTDLCSLGTVYAGSHRADLLLWGNTSSIDVESASLQYYSWERLTAQELDVSLSRAANPHEVRFVFSAGGAQIAVLVLVTKGDCGLLSISGKCLWSPEPGGDDISRSVNAKVWTEASFAEWIKEVDRMSGSISA